MDVRVVERPADVVGALRVEAPLLARAPGSSAGAELSKYWMIRISDCSFAVRLRQWAEHRGAEAALESVPYRTDRAPMLEARYRLSAVGDEIKRRGLAEIAQGPPLPVWGVTAYDPRAPWVVVDDHAGQKRLQRLGEPATQDAG